MELGTKIIGNYGAMIPLSFGEVDDIAFETFANPEVKVKWENGSHTWMLMSEINDAVGKLSPIGHYTEEVYYAS